LEDFAVSIFRVKGMVPRSGLRCRNWEQRSFLPEQVMEPRRNIRGPSLRKSDILCLDSNCPFQDLTLFCSKISFLHHSLPCGVPYISFLSLPMTLSQSAFIHFPIGAYI
jgi:hypothetical protein